jgi:hypothetical protein
MVDGLAARAARGDMPKSFLGFMVKPLVAAARRLDSAKALDLAGRLLGDAFAPGRLFTGGNAFVPGAHMHGTLRTLVGAADWALLRGDAGMLDRVTEIARWVRGIGTRFGFLPECWMRGGDIVSCETCALMDWAGLGATLAHAGRTEFWGPMERLARNHLAESQLRDAAWLAGDDAREDTDQFTWRGLPARLPGAWAGWSSPTHFLAARETLNAHWGGPELRDRTRALQNCCGGSGVHGLYILWKSSAVFDAGTLHVHMHLDRALPQAEVRCLQPWRGLTRVALREACRLRIRVPDFAPADRVRVRVDGRDVRPAVAGGYASLDGCRPGQVVEMEYPVAETSEEIAVGNPGWRQYRYRVTWKGDTVVAVRPQGDVPATGWSDFDKADVPVFYGEDGPCRIYRRDAMRAEAEPALAPLRVEDGGADFWRL